MRMLLLLIVCMFSSSALAQEAKQPVPPIFDKTKRADKFKDNPNNKQTVSIELPASMNVTIAGNLDLKSNSSTNWAEWLIAICTGLLVVVTARLAYYTYMLWESTATASNRQAQEVRDSLVIAKQSADAAKESVRLAREEFISTHRPKIIVRAIYCNDAPDNERQPMPQMTFSIANVGSTPATVFEISATVMDIDWDLCPRPPYASSTKHNTVIHIGNPLPLTIQIPGDVAAQQDMESGFWQGNATFDPSKRSICCFGYILYRDSIEHIYRTAFLPATIPPQVIGIRLTIPITNTRTSPSHFRRHSYAC